MTRRIVRLVLGAILLACAAGPSFAVDQRWLLTSDGQRLWLVHAKGDSFSAVTRLPGESWKWTAKDVPGWPVLAAASVDNLHLLFQGEQFWILNIQGQAAAVSGLSGMRALGSATALHVDDQTVPSCVLAIAVAGGDAQSLPAVASQPATARTQRVIGTMPANMPSGLVGRSALVLYRSLGLEWQELDRLPNVALADKGPIFVTASSGEIWVLVPTIVPGLARVATSSGGTEISSADGLRRSVNTLYCRRDGRWNVVALSEELHRARAIGMITLGGRPVMLMESNPDSRQARLLLASPGPDGEFAAKELTAENKPWYKPVQAVAAARDRAWLLWEENDKSYLAEADLSGLVSPAEQITTLNKPPRDERGRELFENFTLALLTLIFIPLLIVRPMGPPRPFLLPPTMPAASVFRRLLAGLIDLLPFQLISVMVFHPDMQGVELFNATGIYPDELYYAVIASVSGLTFYSILMELRRGATMGGLLMGLRVVGEGGRPPTAREIVLRNLVKAVEMIAMPLLLIAMVWRYHQRLGDIVARTAVINAADARRTGPPELFSKDDSVE